MVYIGDIIDVMKRIDVIKDEISIDRTVENVRGILGRLNEGTKRFKGVKRPLTERQKKRMLNKLDEQNEVLRWNGIPKFRVRAPRQD